MLRSLRLPALINRLVAAHLNWIDRITRRSPRTVLAVLALLVLLSLVSLLRLRFDTDIFRLFPADRPALGLLLDSLEWSGGTREAYFLLEGEPGRLPAAAAAFAERLRGLRVDGAPAFKRVVYRVYEEGEARAFTDLIAFAATYPAAFVSLADRERLALRLQPAGMQDALARLTSQLATTPGSAASSLALADPLGLRELFLPRLKAASQALAMDPDSPYFLSRDGQVLIMIAEPARAVQEMAFARKLVAAINQARSGAEVRISCAGAHISAVIDEAVMKRNIISCILSSLVVVLGIFYATYRRIWPTLTIPLILAVAVLLALGSAGTMLSSIHIISFAFMALIIGLGTDYSIHLYDRFHSERARGRCCDEAVSLAVVDTGHGLFTAAVTTALPFLALSRAEVRALSELGLLVGLGVLFSLYATLLLLPPLLRVTDKPDRSYPPLPGFGLAALWRMVAGGPRLVLGALLLLTLAAGLAATGVRFDGELKNLQPRHSEALIAQEMIERHLSLAPRTVLIAVDAPDTATALRRIEPLERWAAGLEQEGRITAWSSLGRTINRTAEQTALVAQFDGPAQHASTFAEALQSAGFEAAPFESYRQALAQGSLVAAVEPLEVTRRLAASPLRGVVERHLQQDAAGFHVLLYLYHQPGAFLPQQLTEAVRSVEPTARVTSIELVSNELIQAVRGSFVEGFVWGGLLVLILLLAHFRSLGGILAALGPVLFGAAAMLGVMALTGMKLNFMNALVLVTIVGMGSDYGLHIQHRCAEHDAEEGQAARFAQASRGVLLSALTTIAGFGSLAFADYGAMSSIGWATNFGILFTLLAALLMVPAALRLVQR